MIGKNLTVIEKNNMWEIYINWLQLQFWIIIALTVKIKNAKIMGDFIIGGIPLPIKSFIQDQLMGWKNMVVVVFSIHNIPN